jgi:hypothetical protein
LVMFIGDITGLYLLFLLIGVASKFLIKKSWAGWPIIFLNRVRQKI